MDNGINDMAQVLNITANYFELSIKATKGGINLAKNLVMLIMHAIKYGQDKRLENKKGEVKLKKLQKITKNPTYVQTTNDKDCEKVFLKLCKQHGVPVTKVTGLKDSKVTHWLYPSEYASMMESIMALQQEYVTNQYQKKGHSKEEAEQRAKEENRKTTAEEAAEDLGCNMPHKEFKMKFLEQLATPEEKAYYEELDKKKPQISENKRNEIKRAVEKNENREKSYKFNREGMYVVTFRTDQIIGTVERNHEKFVKVRFENDYGQAFLINQKHIVKDGNMMNMLQGAFQHDGDITVYDLRSNSEKTMKFKEFLAENKQSKTGETHREKAQTKSAQSMPALPDSGGKSNRKGKR